MSAIAYCRQKRIPITWAVITSVASKGTGIPWSELTAYVRDAGGELASHSVSHIGDTGQDFIAEVHDSKAWIEANSGGLPCNTFIQPGVWPGDAFLDTWAKLSNPIGQAIQQNYQQSMAYLGTYWSVGSTSYPYGSASTSCIDYSTTQSLAHINRLIDLAAATPGSILVLYAHNVQETGATGTYAIQADVLKAVVDRLAQMRAAGQIRLMSLHDAYHAQFSSNLNHVVDPGFEVSSPPISPDEPTRANGNAAFSDNGGMNDSKCAVIPDTYSSIQTCMRLSPGRYRVSWWQRPFLVGRPVGYVKLYAAALCPGATSQELTNYPRFTFLSTDWEQKSVLVNVSYPNSLAELLFYTDNDSPSGLDNLSVVSEPIDPAVSPSNVSTEIGINRLVVSWDTPNDGSVSDIVIRQSAYCHPQRLSDGSYLGSVHAVPGTRQSLILNDFKWPGQSYMYMSVFAVRSSGASPPELTVIRMVPPANPGVTLEVADDGSVQASWTESDPPSLIRQYAYAVGTSPGRDDIVRWTNTSQTTAGASPVQRDGTVYFSVRAQNLFGNWSGSGWAAFTGVPVLANAFSKEDGVMVTVAGVVTAIFSDCIYIESTDRKRGIRVQGFGSIDQGRMVTVTGYMDTVAGERLIKVYKQ